MSQPHRFLFAIFGYLVAMSSLAAYFWFVQFGMDYSAQADFSWTLFAQDCVWFALFPLQHSLLARPKIKQTLTRLTGDKLERPFYVLTSGVVLWVVLLEWKSFGPNLYNFPHAIVFDIVFYIALVLILLSTVALDHSAMFGLKQGYAAWKETEIPEKDLQTGGLYGVVRHPITTLLIVALWSHRSLTASRLLFNLLFSIYAVAGTWFEERDLIRSFGDRYLAYRNKVPAFIPRLTR